MDEQIPVGKKEGFFFSASQNQRIKWLGGIFSYITNGNGLPTIPWMGFFEIPLTNHGFDILLSWQKQDSHL